MAEYNLEAREIDRNMHISQKVKFEGKPKAH
jgi:hypothetical protein